MGAFCEGAEIMTFFAPEVKWPEAVEELVKTPVDSIMYSAPLECQGMAVGFFSAWKWMGLLFTIRAFVSGEVVMVPLKRPCVVSYWSM